MAHHPQLIVPDSGIISRLMLLRHGAPASRTGCSVRSNRIWPTQAPCSAMRPAQHKRTGGWGSSHDTQRLRHVCGAAQGPLQTG